MNTICDFSKVFNISNRKVACRAKSRLGDLDKSFISECFPGMRFQVFLEIHGFFLVFECSIEIKFSWNELGCVLTFAGIVIT